MSVRANKDTFESEINEAGKLVIADFYSDSCVPCKRMSPLLAETEEEDPEGIKRSDTCVLQGRSRKSKTYGSCKESTACRNNKFNRLRRNGYDYNSSRQ